MTKQETVELTEARKDIFYMQQDIGDLKKAVENLPDELVKKLDERYASKTTVEEIQETIAPFTTFRRYLWRIVISFALTSAFLAVILYEIHQFNRSV